MLQNELKGHIGLVTTHMNPVLQQIRLLPGLNKRGKTRNIAIQSSAAMLQNELHVIVARFTEA